MTGPRPLPVAGDEVGQLLGVLDRNRAVFRWKCSGVDPAGQCATVGVSSMTLGGLVKHLALVEDHTFSVKGLGRDPAPPWDAVDWDADPEWEWRTGAVEPLDGLLTLWEQAVDRSRADVDELLVRGDLGQLVQLTNRAGEHANLRLLVLDIIEEYARHNGHADLIRESVDGLVGEDAPGVP